MEQDTNAMFYKLFKFNTVDIWRKITWCKVNIQVNESKLPRIYF